MENKQMVKDIEDQVAMDMKKECEQFINKMQEEFKIDCIDISRYALAKWRNELNSIIDTEFIENVNIEIDVKVKIKNTGEVT